MKFRQRSCSDVSIATSSVGRGRKDNCRDAWRPEAVHGSVPAFLPTTITTSAVLDN